MRDIEAASFLGRAPRQLDNFSSVFEAGCKLDTATQLHMSTIALTHMSSRALGFYTAFRLDLMAKTSD